MQPRSGDENRTSLSAAPQEIDRGADAHMIALCKEAEGNVATCAVELPADPPEWVHLMTLGRLEARDGRRFTLENAEEVVRASLARSKNLVIDYEHQTDLAEKNGQPAPAAGWIKDLAVRADGIWGRVEWVEKAADHIRNREYRFLSPTFTVAKAAPHQVGIILRAALTNNPALELTALATTQDGDHDMDFLKALAKALGLGDDATEAQVLAALKEKLDGLVAHTALATAARKALDLKDDADAAAIATAVEKLKTDVATAKESGTPDPAKFVPIAQVTELTQEIAQLKAGLHEDKAEAAVEKAMKEGKLPPSLKDWGTAYAKSDLPGFVAYCEKQPVIFKSGSDVPTTPAPAAGQLSEADKAIAKNMGLAEEAFLKTRKSELEASA